METPLFVHTSYQRSEQSDIYGTHKKVYTWRRARWTWAMDADAMGVSSKSRNTCGRVEGSWFMDNHVLHPHRLLPQHLRRGH